MTEGYNLSTDKREDFSGFYILSFTGLYYLHQCESLRKLRGSYLLRNIIVLSLSLSNSVLVILGQRGEE